MFGRKLIGTCSFRGQGGDVQKGWVPEEFSGKLSIFLKYGTAYIL